MKEHDGSFDPSADLVRLRMIGEMKTIPMHKPAWLDRWLQRHRHPVSLCLHLIGIPLTVASIPLTLVQLAQGRWDLWWRPVLLFGVGYLLQWIGHLIEGNDMGEVVLIKKWLGRPYVAVSPRYLPDVDKSQDRSADPLS